MATIALISSGPLKTRLTCLFALFDVNADGVLSLDALTYLFYSVMKGLTKLAHDGGGSGSSSNGYGNGHEKTQSRKMGALFAALGSKGGHDNDDYDDIDIDSETSNAELFEYAVKGAKSVFDGNSLSR
jgi:hypothetical protein